MRETTAVRAILQNPRYTGRRVWNRARTETSGPGKRKMVGNPRHGRLSYRRTASRDFVRQHQISHPPALYLREDQITAPVDRFLREELTGGTQTDNLRRVADAQYRGTRRPRHHR